MDGAVHASLPKSCSMARGMTAGSHFIRTTAAVAAVVAFTASCAGADEASSVAPIERVPETVDIGGFPEPLTGDSVPLTVPVTVVPTTSATTTEPPPDPITGPIGDEVFGNRIIVIGDTSIVATAPRSGGELCEALEAFGWQAEIAAEVGRFVEFGRVVYDARIAPATGDDWDVVAVMLGNHFQGDVAAYRQELDELVEALGPRPTIVYTLVENDTYQADLNEIIRELPRFHPHVVVVDWAEIVAAETDVLTADTPSGLSDEGGRRLALFTAAALGEAPLGDEPGCLEPFFVDDSAIVL